MLEKSSEETQKARNENKVKKDIYYITQCKRCGSLWDLSGSNVGRVKSCGCLSKTKWMDKAESHIGEKYGKLTIMRVDWERTESQRARKDIKTRDIYYFTECECGNKPEISSAYNSLKTGHIKSCGCSKFNNPLIVEDLTGQTFGRLTVVARDLERDKKEIDEGRRRGNAHWLCKCSCGNPNLKSVVGNQLKSGSTQSCGCYASEMIAERNRIFSSKYNRPETYKKNNIDEDENVMRIWDENHEYSFLIDSQDYDSISHYYWRKEVRGDNPNKWYWITNGKKDDSLSIMKVHQIIAENKYGVYDHKLYVPDHLSRDPDDNRRCNIKLKTNADNSKNRKLSKVNTSGKTGVYYRQDIDKWIASITVNYKTIFLGNFDNYDDAVATRLEAEKKYGFTCDDITAEYDYEVI